MRKHLLLAVVAAVALACSGEKDPAPRVEITLPRGQVHVRDALTVQVTADDASSVELWRDGARLASLTPPYQYVWDTRAEAEGSHQLVARAQGGGGAVESQPLAVVVDRTAPTVVSRFPDIGTEVAWTGDTLRLRFSEPIAWSAIADGIFALSGDGAGAAGVTVMQFGEDALVLRPDAPLRGGEVSVHVAPGAITDLAGNPVAFPDGGWSFTVGEVALLGGDMVVVPPAAASVRVDLAFDARGDVRALVATPGRVLSQRYGPQGWSEGPELGWFTAVALRATIDPVAGVAYALVQTDWDGAFALWREDAGRWNELTRFASGDRLGSPVLAVSGGIAVVAWTERPSGASGAYVRAAWWDGSALAMLGDPLNLGGAAYAYEPAVAVTAGGPMVAWTQDESDGTHVRLARWSAGSWQPVASPATTWGASQPCLAAGGSTLLVWRQASGADAGLRVARYLNDTTWDAQAGITSSLLAERPAIAVDASHRAAVAFLDQEGYGGYALRVATTPGIEWTLDPAPWSVAETMTPPRLALGSAGEPVVAWTEGENGNDPRAYVARANR